jgi:hypothetical protein
LSLRISRLLWPTPHGGPRKRKYLYHLDKFYQIINKKASSGLEILGGLKLKYFLTTSLGENNSNGLKKEVLDSTKI